MRIYSHLIFTKMKWKARKKMGYMPAQIEVVWDRGNGFFTQVAETVCPHRPGDLIEKQRNEVAAMIENAPAMVELLRDIANPKRGSEAEKWSIHNAAHAAQEILARIESTVIA
jgi:hypothetical protein